MVGRELSCASFLRHPKCIVGSSLKPSCVRSHRTPPVRIIKIVMLNNPNQNSLGKAGIRSPNPQKKSHIIIPHMHHRVWVDGVIARLGGKPAVKLKLAAGPDCPPPQIVPSREKLGISRRGGSLEKPCKIPATSYTPVGAEGCWRGGERVCVWARRTHENPPPSLLNNIIESIWGELGTHPKAGPHPSDKPRAPPPPFGRAHTGPHTPPLVSRWGGP